MLWLKNIFIIRKIQIQIFIAKNNKCLDVVIKKDHRIYCIITLSSNEGLKQLLCSNDRMEELSWQESAQQFYGKCFY